MITNFDTYLAIAEEAFAEAEKLDLSERTPREDGQPGYVIKYDPERRSFKKSLIAIAFYGMYLDALLYMVTVQRFGKSGYNKFEKQLKCKQYKDRLLALGITDSDLLASCQHFRDARNDMVHEKAFEISEIQEQSLYAAQKVAKEGADAVRQITKIFRSPL